MDNKQEVWLEEGYKQFSKKGIEGLKIDLIAKAIGKSRSSFYYHFGDLDVFVEELLKHHIERMRIFAEYLNNCKEVEPDILEAFVKFKLDLFFNKQLRLNRQNSDFSICLEKGINIIYEVIIDIWAAELDLKSNIELARQYLEIITDNLGLVVTEEVFEYEWLKEYWIEKSNFFKQVRTTAK